MYFEKQYVKYTLEDMKERYTLLQEVLQNSEQRMRDEPSVYEKGIHMGQVMATETELMFLKRTMKFLSGALE